MSSPNEAINSSDIDIIPDESFIDHNVNRLTLKQRIEGHTLPCYSYTKHWSKSPNCPSTGYVLLTNETTNLSIIEQRATIRDTLLSRLSSNDIIVQSTSGSLHIYTNTDDFQVYQNALIKCFKSEDFDIDIFSSVNPSKQSFVVLPNSKVRPNHKSKINKYKFIQGSFDSVIKRSLKDVLHNLNIKITIAQTPEITKITNDNKQYNISDELAEALINGLSGLTIHNDGKGQTINDEINLYILCQTINTFIFNNIRDKSENHEYITDKQVIEDMSRCLRFIDDEYSNSLSLMIHT